MQTSWPVGVIRRASFIFAVTIAGVAWADAGDVVVAARAQQGSDVPRFAAALTTGDASVRAAAAFALGQLGVAWEPVEEVDRAAAEKTLLAAMAREKDANVRDREVEALGKVGSATALPALEQFLDGDLRARAAIAVAALAKKGVRVPDSTRLALEKQLHDGDARARWAAALALWRAHAAASRVPLRTCLADREASVRAQAAQALGEIGSDDEAGPLAELVQHDGDVRVAAEAARTLVKLAMRCASDGKCVPLEALGKTHEWRPSVVQAVSFEKWRDARAVPPLRARYDEIARAPLDARTRALTGCRAALAHDRARGRIELLRACGSGIVDDAHRGVLMAQALAAVGGAELEPLTRSPHAAVRAAAAEGADAQTTQRLLGDADALVVEAAADRAGDLGLPAAGDALVAALRRLRGSDALEAQQSVLGAGAKLHVAAMVPLARALVDVEPYALRQAAAHALTALEGKPIAARPPTLPTTRVPKLPPTVVVLQTTRGRIRVRLWVDDAPRTAANFVALVERHFYDGLTFHRVVPDFVSQAGDPRGDGSGGPGYMIPCEINPRRYGAGVMGMALAGRDTGGSQFFFTHTATPHLDGKYTAFGEIIEGFAAAIAMVEGDVIVSARVE